MAICPSKMVRISSGRIKFWEDKWLGTTTLREQYPALYNIVLGRHKSGTLAKVLEVNPPNVTFRRDLVGPRLAA